MLDSIKKEIIDLYLNNIGSTTIEKILSIPKKQILKVLHDNNILRNKNHSDDDYKDFWFENGKWFTFWKCTKCGELIKCQANKKCILFRNVKKKTNCRKCYKLSQQGKGNIFYGKHHTDKTIEKISKTKTGVSTSDHMKKIKYRELFREITQKRWDDGKMEVAREKSSKRMKDMIKNGEFKGYNRSKAEDEIIKVLTDNNIECTPNFLIDCKIFDILIPKYNLLIEYNGDYWHCNPKKYESEYFNVKKQKTAKEIWEYDKEKLDLAKKNGYIVEVIWEDEYNIDNNIILKKIKNYDERIK